LPTVGSSRHCPQREQDRSLSQAKCRWSDSQACRVERFVVDWRFRACVLTPSTSTSICCRDLMGPRTRVSQPGKPPSNFHSPSKIQPVKADAACAHPETSSSGNGRPIASTQSSSKNKNKERDCTHFLFAIWAAVAAFGFSSMAAVSLPQLPYRSSPP
jgi:hypothetical protein